MRHIRFGTGFAIFVLFFGIALLDAFREGAWLRAAFWCAIGILFIALDSVKRRS
jgi:hypothetical protein